MNTYLKKGIFFTIDAILALLVLFTIIHVFTFLNVQMSSPSTAQELLHLQAEDAIDVMAKLTVWDLRRETSIRELYSQGVLDELYENKTLLDAMGSLWATNTSENFSRAGAVVYQVMGPFVASRSWSFIVANDTLYNTTNYSAVADSVYMSSISRRIASGFMKSAPSTGYAARAFTESIFGSGSSSYAFFGGFVGEGNVSAYIRDIPADANFSSISLELNTPANFSLYINGEHCADLTVSGSSFAVSNWTITDPSCLGNLTTGSTRFDLNFTSGLITQQYFGGGYVKITYDTNNFAPAVTNKTRYYFPGIDGLVNLYDSFFVPGEIENITIYLKIKNNYTTLLNIGNKTVIDQNGTASVQELYFYDANLTMLNYSEISDKTIPLRLTVQANVTGGRGNADVILITDLSGSMDWRMDSDSTSSVDRTCNDPLLNASSTSRISVAKCIDKTFVETVLSNPGNKIGLVSFSTNAAFADSINLTDNLALLESEINNYTAGGSTCLSCAINRAYDILRSDSNSSRIKLIVVMSDGATNQRSTPNCASLYGVSSNSTTSTFSVGLSGLIAMRNQTGAWNNLSSPVTNTLRSVSIYNSTFAFAVGDSGRILQWDGTSWTNINHGLTTRTLYGVSIYNSTLAFAVGAGGSDSPRRNILKWNGVSWARESSIPVSNTLYSVSIQSGTLAFAVGTSGRIISWNGATWSSVSSPTSDDIYGVHLFNSTLGFAVCEGGRIIRWSGSTWSSVYNSGNDLYGVHLYSPTLGFAVGSGGRILRWDGSSWGSAVYPVTDALRSVFILDASSAFAVGDYGDIAEWNGGSWAQNYNFPYAYQGTSSTSAGCTDAYDCDTPLSFSELNANWSACRAHDNFGATPEFNITVHSVGFGPGFCGTMCAFAVAALKNASVCGNGSFLASCNYSELDLWFRELADTIVVQATVMQEINATGNFSAVLYPESYIEFEYQLPSELVGYRQVLVTTETAPFGGCNGGFFIPAGYNVTDIKITSYSANYWTDNLSINNSGTGGAWRNVYNLSVYRKNYTDMGDPFIVQFPASLLRINETNYVRVGLGINSTNKSSTCSANDRAIYSALISAFVPYSGVFPNRGGHNVTVYIDTDHDGVADKNVSVAIGAGLPGFDPTPVTVDQLDPANNALDDALLRLLEQLNYYIQPGATGLAGSSTNPIDLEISSQVQIDTTLAVSVPFLWGPTDMSVVVWN